MKKTLLIVTISSLLPTFCGCNFLSPTESDTKEVGEEEKAEVIISGSLTKTDYAFEDEWDISGIKVYEKFPDGTQKELKEKEYTVTLNPKKPRGFKGTSLKITAKPKDGTQSKTKTFTGITVAKEVYDEASEINSYYEDLDDIGKTGNNLLKELQRHTYEKHTKYIQYGNIASYYGVTDEHRSIDEIPGEYKLESFYTGNKSPFGSGSKEHVWACNDSSNLWRHDGSGNNDVDQPTYKGGGSDLYQVRPCNQAVNTARGDASFTELKRGESVGDGGPYKLTCSGGSYYNGNYEYADYVEPADEFKGDFARIIAYVYMHYKNFGSSYRYTGSLNLNSVISTNGTSYSSAGALLKAWNDIDPVSEVERYRNHTVEKIQGNRNPFVDFPDYIDDCF